MLTIGVSQVGEWREFAVLPSSNRGWSTESQDVSSGWWKDQEGERVQVQVQLKRG